MRFALIKDGIVENIAVGEAEAANILARFCDSVVELNGKIAEPNIGDGYIDGVFVPAVQPPEVKIDTLAEALTEAAKLTPEDAWAALTPDEQKKFLPLLSLTK